MKVLSLATTLVLATALSSISFSSVAAERPTQEEVYAHWEDVQQVIPKEYIQDDDGNWWFVASAANKKLLTTKPKPGSSAGGNRRQRRKLQDSEVKPAEGSYHHEGMILFSSPFDTTLSDITFIFESEDTGDVLEEPAGEADILDGVVVKEMGGFLQISHGLWTWHIEGTDASGATVSTDPMTFQVGEEIVRRSGTHTTVDEAPWNKGGQVLEASGRIYFSSTDDWGDTWDYACTGTAIKDNKSGRSLILTAAHCTWDDIDRNFGFNAIFIPNRDANEMGADAFRNCTMDACGCWTLSGGVVHDKWKDIYWPDNLPWDYGLWVVDDEGAHRGPDCAASDALDEAVNEMEFVVGTESAGSGEFVHNFGYSLDYDPDFRYCAEEMTTRDAAYGGPETFWMPSCLHSGGASGGPWIQDMDESTGTGKIFSVNSWSSGSSGMGGPMIEASAARCLVNAAREVDIEAMEAEDDEYEGIFVNCYDRPCIPEEEAVRRKLRGQPVTRELCEKHN